MTKRDLLLQALASTVPDLYRLGRGFTEPATVWQSTVTEWSALNVLGHLIAVEQLYQKSIQLIKLEERPMLEALPSGAGVHYQQANLGALTDRFAVERECTLQILEALSPGAWQRVAIHDQKGPMIMRYLIQDLVAHDIEHTSQLVENQVAWRKTMLPNEAAGAGGNA